MWFKIGFLMCLATFVVQNCDAFFDDHLLPWPFKQKRKWTYLGCYQDSIKVRDLQNMVSLLDPAMTVDVCQIKCNGWPFFGIAEGGTCFCGRRYGLYGKLPEAVCNQKCMGAPTSPNQKCGGNLANSVYTILDVEGGVPPPAGGTATQTHIVTRTVGPTSPPSSIPVVPPTTPAIDVPNYWPVSVQGMECEDVGNNVISRAAGTTADNCAIDCMRQPNCYFFAYGQNCIQYVTCYSAVPSADASSVIYAMDRPWPAGQSQICAPEGLLSRQPQASTTVPDCAQACMNVPECTYFAYVFPTSQCTLYDVCSLVPTDMETMVVQMRESGGQSGSLPVRIVDQNGDPFGNIPVYVVDESTNPIAEMVTDASGQATITAPAGTYYVVPQFTADRMPQEEYAEVSFNPGQNPPQTLVFTIPEGNNMGELQLNFVDIDGNPLPGATVNFYQDTVLVESTVSDGKGYVDVQLPGGDYTMEIGLPEGYVLVGEDPVFDVTVPPGETMTGTVTVEASKEKPVPASATLKGTVYNDKDQDSRLDSGEGLAGVPIVLLSSNQPLADQVTDESGYYEFTGLDAGSYVVQMGPIPNQSVVSGTQKSNAINVAEGSANTYNFRIVGNIYPPSTTAVRPTTSPQPARKAKVTIRVFLDANWNEIYESDEQLLADIPVTFSTDDNTVVGEGTTSANGLISFDNLDTGYYIVDIDVSSRPNLEMSNVQGVVQVSRPGEQISVEVAIQTQ